MKPNFFLCLFLLLFSFLVSAAVPSDYFTRHDELAPIGLKLNFGNQTNTYVNQFGEKELWLDSVHADAYVEAVPFSGTTALVGEPLLLKIDVDKPFDSMYPFSNTRIFQTAIDHKRLVSTEASGNKIFIHYNPLSQECGGNYMLSFKASSSLKPGQVKYVHLRFHIPCKADLLIVLSPLMGEPSLYAADSMRDYISEVSKTGKSARVATLSQNAVQFSDLPYYAPSSGGESAKGEFELETPDKSAPNKDQSRQLIQSSLAFFREEVKGPNVGAFNNAFITSSGQIANSPVLRFTSHGQVVAEQELQLPPDKRKFKYFIESKAKEFTGQAYSSSYETEQLAWYKLELPNHKTAFFFPSACKAGGTDFANQFNLDIFDPEEYFSQSEDRGSSISCDKFLSQLPVKGQAADIEDLPVKVLDTGSIKWLKKVSVEVDGTFRIDALIYRLDEFKRGAKVKKELALLRSRVSPNYLMLVGSTEHIPMQAMKVAEDTFGSNNPSFVSYFLVSDSMYLLNPDTNQVEIPVGRVPVALDDHFPWLSVGSIFHNLANARKSTFDPEKIAILSDACGGEGNCHISLSSYAAAQLFWKGCAGNSACLLSAPNCGDGQICNAGSKLCQNAVTVNAAFQAKVDAVINATATSNNTAYLGLVDTIYANNQSAKMAVFDCDTTKTFFCRTFVILDRNANVLETVHSS